jgi:hypothetical protein
MTERSEERPTTTEAGSYPRRWLERIKIHRFRSVEPGTELCFSEGLHVVLGKNASGKSTLLELIAAAFALDFERSPFHDELLDLEFTLRVGDLHVEASIKRELRDPKVPGVPEDVEGRTRSLWEEGRYVLRAPAGLTVTVVLSSDDLPRRTVDGGDPAPYGFDKPLDWHFQLSPLAPGPDGLYVMWFHRVSETFTDLWGADALLGGAFGALFRMAESDEFLDVFEEDSFTILLGKSASRHPVLLPDRIFQALPREGKPIEVSLALEPSFSPFIREMGFTEARMSLGPPRVERHFGQEVFAYSQPMFTFYRDGRLVRRIDQLSYGQRRMFALGWYLAEARDVAILDEPSNGLHESWIAFLVSQLQGRQVFLTSQNRELLDMLPFQTEAELSRGFVLCEAHPQPEADEPALHWRGLRDEEAALMIKALRSSRVDLITDLLRALDLW